MTASQVFRKFSTQYIHVNQRLATNLLNSNIDLIKDQAYTDLLKNSSNIILDIKNTSSLNHHSAISVSLSVIVKLIDIFDQFAASLLLKMDNVTPNNTYACNLEG